MTSTVKPPSCNTGAQINVPLENRSIIDWFAFTIKKNDPYLIADMLGLGCGLFSELERGGMGYKKRIQYGHITIYFDGSENMGCHCEISGQGCREYEASKHTWRDLIAFIDLEKGKITRLDIAVDTVDGSLPLSKIESSLEMGLVRSQFTKTRSMQSATLTPSGLKDHAKSIYFGSGTSRCMFRIYDKAAQSGINTDNFSHFWIRFELQLRDERASVAAAEILRLGDLGFIAAGIINQYIAFINNDSSNRSKCSFQEWWFNWIHHTEKLKLTLSKVIKTISQVQDYIKKQYAPTFAMLKKALGFASYTDFMSDVISTGYSRMTQKHEQIVLNSRLCSNLPF